MKARAVVTGATGLLGGYLVAELERAGRTVLACGSATLDVTQAAEVEALVIGARARAQPELIINACALSGVADCLRDPERAARINVAGAAHLARAARAVGARFVHLSTDMVFDGERAPYREDDAKAPISVYGKTKLEGEGAALDAHPDAAIVRLALLFGPTRTARRGFFDEQLAALRDARPLTLFDDEWRTPLSLRAAAEGIVAIAEAGVAGPIHLGGPERLTRHEMGVGLARAAGLSDRTIAAGSRALASAAGAEPRPRDLALDSSRFQRLFPGLARASFEEECRRMLGADC